MTRSEIDVLIATSKAMQHRAIACVLASCEADIQSYRKYGREVPIRIEAWAALSRQRLRAMEEDRMDAH